MKKKKKSVCYKKFDEFPEGLMCCFCNTSINDSAVLGEIYKICDVIMHYFCLLSASEIEQRGDDKEALLGFYTRDIKKEIARGLGNACFYCQKKGATVSCFDSSCDITFHLPCGLDHGSLHQYYDSFRSYCRKHKPKQAIPPKLKKSNLECPMCVTPVKISKEPFIWPPCCKPGLFLHKVCCQKLASNSGYALKCPMCNNKDDFVQSLKKYGIYIPDQEATWELEEMNDRNRRDPDIVECLAEKYDSTCKCPKGKLFSVKSSPRWYIEICVYCGGGMHLGCMPIPLPRGELYKCELCMKVDQGKNEDVNVGGEKQLSDCLRSCEAGNELVLAAGSIVEAQSDKKGISKKLSQGETDLSTNREMITSARTSTSRSVSCQSYNVEKGSQQIVTITPSSTSTKETAKCHSSSTSTILGAVTKTPGIQKLMKSSPSSSTTDNKKPSPAATPCRRKRCVLDKSCSSSRHSAMLMSEVKKSGCKTQLEIHDDILIIISSDSDSDSSSCKNLPSDKYREHGSDVMMLCTHTDLIRRKRGQLPHDVPSISVQLDYDSCEDLPSSDKEEGKTENSKTYTTTINDHQLSTRIESRKHEKTHSKNIISVNSDHQQLERSKCSKLKKSHKISKSNQGELPSNVDDNHSSTTLVSRNVEKLNNTVQAISDHQATFGSVSRKLRSNYGIPVNNDPQPPAGSEYREFIDVITTKNQQQIMEGRNDLLEKTTGELELNIDSVCSLPAECWSQDNDLEVSSFMLSPSRTKYPEVITLSSDSEDETQAHQRTSISNEKSKVTKSELAATTKKRNTIVSSPNKKKTKHSDTSKTPERDNIILGNEISGNGFNENINYPNHQFITSENICHVGSNNSDDRRAVKKMRFTFNENTRVPHVESLNSEHLSYPPMLALELPLSCISQDSRKRIPYCSDVPNLGPGNSSLVSSVNNTMHSFSQIESPFKIIDMTVDQVKEIKNNVGLCKETVASSSQDTMLVKNQFNFPSSLGSTVVQALNSSKRNEKGSVEENATQDPLANGIAFAEVSDSSQLLPILNNETSVLSHENLYLSSDLNESSKECKTSFGDSSLPNISHEKQKEFLSLLKSSTSLSTFPNCSERELPPFIWANEEESTLALNEDLNFQGVLHHTTVSKCELNNDSSLIINKPENIHLQHKDESSVSLKISATKSCNIFQSYCGSNSPIKNEIFYSSSEKSSSNEVVLNKQRTEILDPKTLNEMTKECETLALRFDESSYDIINKKSIPEVLNNILNKICLEDNTNLCEIGNKEEEFDNSNSLRDKQTSFEPYPLDSKQMDIIEKDRVQMLCEKFESASLDGLSGKTGVSRHFQENNISEKFGFDGPTVPPQWYKLCSYKNCTTCRNSCDYISSISYKDNEVIQCVTEEIK